MSVLMRLHVLNKLLAHEEQVYDENHGQHKPHGCCNLDGKRPDIEEDRKETQQDCAPEAPPLHLP